MRRFLALSRTGHAVLDIAAPAFCALLTAGDFPPLPKVLLSLVTAFAAYTSVYALNDLMGIEADREKFIGININPGYGVESSEDRHPLAQNLLGMRQAILWMGGWFVLALIGSYFLNPVVALVLLAGAAVEVIYCRLLKVTYLRTLLSGLVKTSGPVAAVLALDPHPPLPLLLVLFAWLFFWEIGGQNIPSDWNYTEEDRRANAKTVPIRFGFRTTGLIILMALLLTVGMSVVAPLVSRAPLGMLYTLTSLAVGYILLLRPGLELYKSCMGALASRLFDRASYYPLAQLTLISTFLLADKLMAS